MLRRKIYDQLLSWKAKKHEKGMKECLLIKGARQVGKSYIVEQFGKENYESFVNINFITQPELKKRSKATRVLNAYTQTFPSFYLTSVLSLIIPSYF